MTEAQFKAGDQVIFKGYSEAVEDELLHKGERCRVVSIDTEGAYALIPVNDDGTDKRSGGVAYPDEVSSVADYQAQLDADAAHENAEHPAEQAADIEAHASKGSKASKAAVKKAVTAKGKETAPAAKAAEKPAAKAAAKTAKAAEEDRAAATAPAAPTAAAKKAVTAKGKKNAEAQASLPIEAPAESFTAGPENSERSHLPVPEGNSLEIHHSSSVAALLAQKDALEAADELVRRNEETEFTLGGILAHIQREGIHQSIGFHGKRGFEEYIETRLGVKYRKARYLITIYEAFTALNIDEARIAEIGWSKLKELVGVANQDNVEKLLDYAKKNTRDALIEHVKNGFVEGGTEGSDTKVRQTTMKFVLYEDQAGTVTRALDAAKGQAGTDDPNAALEHICGEWSLMADNNKLDLAQTIALVESRFGVKLEVTKEVGAEETQPAQELEAA